MGWLCYSIASNILTYMHTAPGERTRRPDWPDSFVRWPCSQSPKFRHSAEAGDERRPSSNFLTSPPPAEKAAARQNQAGRPVPKNKACWPGRSQHAQLVVDG
jgi:hypothetical protein